MNAVKKTTWTKMLVLCGLLLMKSSPALAGLTEKFKYSRAFVDAIALYKTSDDRIWPDSLRSTATVSDPNELIKPYRSALYRLSLDDLSKATALLAPYVENKNADMAEGAKSILTVIELVRKTYQAELDLIDSPTKDESAAIAILAKDHNEGRVQRIAALMVASGFLNKVLQGTKGKVSVTEAERIELIKLIDLRFPMTKSMIEKGDQAELSMESAMVLIRPLLSKSKGKRNG